MKKMNGMTLRTRSVIILTIVIILGLQICNYIRLFNTKATPAIDEYLTCQYAHYYMAGAIGNLNSDAMRMNEWIDINPLKESTYIDKESSVFSHSFIDVAKQSIDRRFYFLYVNILGTNTRNRLEWFKYVLYFNIVLTIITEILLYKILIKLTNNPVIAMLAIIAWGFSGGIISCTLYVRFYAHVYMLCTIILYLYLTIWTTKKAWVSIVCILICHLIAFWAYKESEIVIPFYAFLVCIVSVALLAKKRVWEGVILGPFSIAMGMVFLYTRTSFIDAIIHPNKYRGDKYSKLGDTLEQFSNISFGKMMENFLIVHDNIRRFFWGARITGLIITVFVLASIILLVIKRVKNKNSITNDAGAESEEYVSILLIVFLCFSVFMITAGLTKMRHYQVIMPALVVVVIYFSYHLFQNISHIIKHPIFQKKPIIIFAEIFLGMMFVYGAVKTYIRGDYEFLFGGGQDLYTNLQIHSDTDAVLLMPNDPHGGYYYYAFIDFIDWDNRIFAWEYEDKPNALKIEDDAIVWFDSDDKNAYNVIEEFDKEGYNVENMGSNRFCSAYYISVD